MLEKILAWLLLFSMMTALWALIVLAWKTVRLLRELRLYLAAAGMAIQVTKNKQAEATSTLGRVEAATTQVKAATARVQEATEKLVVANTDSTMDLKRPDEIM